MRKIVAIFCFSFAFINVHGKCSDFFCDEEITAIQSHYSISFGDTIETGVSGDEHASMVSWNVSPQVGVNKTAGTGGATGELIFAQPGEYKITFNIPAHGESPAKTEVVTVQVSNVKMVVDAQNVQLSRKLTVGDASGIVMTVPVAVKVFDNQSYEYVVRDINTTGVAHLTQHLKDGKQVLKNGHNELQFELSGAISQSGQIQFRVYNANKEATFFNQIIH